MMMFYEGFVLFVKWKQADLMGAKLTERMNKEILQRIAKVREMKRIDDTWSAKFMRKWYTRWDAQRIVTIVIVQVDN